MLQRPHVHFRRSSRLKDSARVGFCCLSVSLPLASLDLQGESENFLSILAYSTSLACSDESSIQASHSGSGLSLIEKIALLIIITFRDCNVRYTNDTGKPRLFCLD